MRRLSVLMVTVVASLFCTSVASTQEQFPIMDRVASKVIQKYRQESCPQIADQRDQPKSPQELRVIQLLRDDPQMRKAFIDRIAAPIANKLFECGMIP